MSLVDNWILCSEILDEDQFLDAVNRHLLSEPGPYNQGFSRVDHYAGGSKALEADVFLLASNYGDSGHVIDSIKKAIAELRVTEAVQLLHKGQEQIFWGTVFHSPDSEGLPECR